MCKCFGTMWKRIRGLFKKSRKSSKSGDEIVSNRILFFDIIGNKIIFLDYSIHILEVGV